MERRKSPRTSVGKLAYVNFEPYDTGGVITDISATGFRFHTVAPLRQGGILRLSLVLAGMSHLEVVGEVVWTDSTRKVGGVRFVVLPSAAIDRIKKWLENENSVSVSSNQTGPKYEAVAPLAASAAAPQQSDVPTGSTLASRRWVLPGNRSTMLSTMYFDTDPPHRRSQVGAVILCLMVAPLVWFGVRRYNWLSSWVLHANPVLSNPLTAASTPTPESGVLPGLDVSNSVEANSEQGNPAEATSVNTANPAPPMKQAQPAVPNPNSQAADTKIATVTESPETNAAETTLAPKAEAAAPGHVETAQSPSEQPPLTSSPRNFVVPASKHEAQIPASLAPQPAENPGESELILAWQYLEGQGGRPRDPVAASRLLWIAVSKGNLAAETTLANLYLRGEGVPKSCDQARVLLSAASDKGGVEAKQKLRELKQTGCK